MPTLMTEPIRAQIALAQDRNEKTEEDVFRKGSKNHDV